jgi:hypothetical protein
MSIVADLIGISKRGAKRVTICVAFDGVPDAGLPGPGLGRDADRREG